VRDLHRGIDLATRGVFNVRAYDCHGAIAACVAAGVDAVNADLEELPLATKLSASVKPN
jgi:hypothetical protein